MQLIEQFVTVDILVTNKKTRTKNDTNPIDACFGWQERNSDNKVYVINMILLKIIRRGFPVKQYTVLILLLFAFDKNCKNFFYCTDRIELSSSFHFLIKHGLEN